MESASSIEDYTVRVAQAWKVGQKGRNNGAVLFVFVQDRKMFIQVGYGLEGALPDATCKRIIEDEIKPHFRNNDFDGGLSAGVTAILRAAKGEYKAAGHSPAPLMGNEVGFLILGLFLFALLFVSWKVRRAGGRWHGVTLGSSGWSSGWGSSGWSSGGSGGGGGGFSGGGGWSGGGDSGGFSSGGGSFGGGGAGGSW